PSVSESSPRRATQGWDGSNLIVRRFPMCDSTLENKTFRREELQRGQFVAVVGITEELRPVSMCPSIDIGCEVSNSAPTMWQSSVAKPFSHSAVAAPFNLAPGTFLLRFDHTSFEQSLSSAKLNVPNGINDPIVQRFPRILAHAKIPTPISHPCPDLHDW